VLPLPGCGAGCSRLSRDASLESLVPYLRNSMDNLASAYRRQGRWTEAEKLQVRVMETRKTVLGPEHPHTLTSMDNLASTYRRHGRWTEAEKLQVQVMERYHPSTLRGMCNLSHTLEKLRRHDEALSMLQACVRLRNQRLGPSHPHTVDATATLKAWQSPFENPSLQGPAPIGRSCMSSIVSTVRGAIKSKKEK
jgi:tetratricopeptide repeat protein